MRKESKWNEHMQRRAAWQASRDVWGPTINEDFNVSLKEQQYRRELTALKEVLQQNKERIYGHVRAFIEHPNYSLDIIPMLRIIEQYEKDHQLYQATQRSFVHFMSLKSKLD